MIPLLRAVSLCQVARTRTDKEHVARTILPHQMAEPDRLRFENYFHRVHIGKQDIYREVIFTDADGKFIKKHLDELRKLPATGSQARRDELTALLATRLSNKMRESPVALPGVLFVIHLEFEGKTHVVLVKLKLDPRDISSIESKQGVDDLLFSHFEKALPDAKEKFRKVLLYPFPGDEADARTGQEDHEADYWEKFIGGQVRREAQKTTAAVVDEVREMLRSEGKELEPAEAVELIAELQKPIVDFAEVAKVVKKKTPLSKGPAKIAERLKERLEEPTLPKPAPAGRIIYSIEAGDLSFSVPANLVGEKVVQVHQEGDDVVIRIRQSTYSWKLVPGRPE